MIANEILLHLCELCAAPWSPAMLSPIRPPVPVPSWAVVVDPAASTLRVCTPCLAALDADGLLDPGAP